MQSSAVKEFLEKIPDNNTEFVTQQILTRFTDAQLGQLNATFKKLDQALYKGWAQEMSFREIHEAISEAVDLSKK